MTYTGLPYYCRACDVYGRGRACWSCGTWHTAKLGVSPHIDGSPQVHTHARAHTTCVGKIIPIEPVDCWSEVIGCG